MTRTLAFVLLMLWSTPAGAQDNPYRCEHGRADPRTIEVRATLPHDSVTISTPLIRCWRTSAMTSIQLFLAQVIGSLNPASSGP